MKQLFILSFILLGVLQSCGNDASSSTSGIPKYLVGTTWETRNKSNTQQLVFRDETNAWMILTGKNADTFAFKYTYRSDTDPIQLDWHNFDPESPLRGLNVFGVLEFTHRDSFTYNSGRGRIDDAEEMRPKEIDPARAAVYYKK